MTARQQIISRLSEDSYGGIATLADVARAEQLADAHRAEVLREAKREVVAWLVKKAREDTPVGDLASKVDRGAIRLFLNIEEKATTAAATATPGLTVYQAQHDAIVMGLYTTRQAAYEHCEAYELRDDSVSPMAWNVDEDGVAELVRLRIPRSPGAESATGYVVTPVEVASAYDAEADE